MSLPLAETSHQPAMPIEDYPVAVKQAAAEIHGVHTDVTSTLFADKIMVTISQDGRLAQWIHVPLDPANPNFAEQHLPSSTNEDSLLPLAHLSPKTLLGGSSSERETMGQLYAAQIATAILTRNPEEKRTVLIGLGISKFEAKREIFYDIVDLVTSCL